jgi:hypothetical protein
MTLRQPMASRPLALLTLAVAGAHLLLLDRMQLQDPLRPAGMRALVTRVVTIVAPETGVPAAVQKPVDQERAAAPRVRRSPRALPSTPIASAPAPDAVAVTVAVAAAPATPSSAAAAPAPSIDNPAASAPEAPAAPAMSYAIPGSVRLKYHVTGMARGQTWNLNGQLLWRHDGSQYQALLEYSAPLLPSRSQHSSGRITAEGLAPQRFSDRSRSEQATHFQRDSGILVFSNNAPPQPLLPGAQDRLSVFLQLAAMLAAEPAKFPAGTGITVQTVGTRDSQPWLFTVEGDEALDLPGGRVPTRKLVRNPLGEYDIRIELWLGSGMDYVPVRIRLTQPNGDFVDQQWASTDRS